MRAEPLSGKHVAIIGGGPAGLMAAEVIAQAGLAVTVFERMPNVGRKLLMAGRGGLNLTHSEPIGQFIKRYGEAAEWIAPLLAAFPPKALIDWCEGLGQPTFVGTSGRVFPKAMKASPLLRAWIARLSSLGVSIVTRARDGPDGLTMAPSPLPMGRSMRRMRPSWHWGARHGRVLALMEVGPPRCPMSRSPR